MRMNVQKIALQKTCGLTELLGEWFSICIVRGGGIVNGKVYFGWRGVFIGRTVNFSLKKRLFFIHLWSVRKYNHEGVFYAIISIRK